MNIKDDDEVGYGRPPKHSRFRPGQSGNPNGRPKRLASFHADLLAELQALIPSPGPDGAGAHVTKQQAIARSLIAAAVAGNVRAQSLLVPVLLRSSEPDGNAEGRVTDEERDMLETYVEREIHRRGLDKPSSGQDKSTEQNESNSFDQ